ncbi:MAG TPA: carboxypeptidase-like regulatory domain-containing protein [Bryobacteraceae bacterium]|jgi:hypothetical protein|nr:carboxypeptidase-like regulatory domain-containing protein [Bryobacteraceae bacterium]
MRTALSLIIGISAVISFGLVQALAQDTSSVQGRVLSKSTAAPLRGMKIYLVSATESGFQRSAESRQDGSFAFDSVPAGRYLVLDEAELTSYVRWHRPSASDVANRAVEVKAGQTSPHVLIYLSVGAIIQGRVTGADHQPIRGLQVTALGSMTIDGLARKLPAGSATTLEDGTYQIIWLRAGTYFLAAEIQRRAQDGIEIDENVQAGPTDSLVRTFYPGTLAIKSASPVTLVADQVFSDANIQMRRGSVYSLRGIVVHAAEGYTYKVYVQRELDVSSLRMIRVAEDRSFSIGGLLPGQYGLELLDTTPVVPRWPAVLAYMKVEVNAEDVKDVQLAIRPPPIVLARAVVTGAADMENLRLFLRPTSNPTAQIVFSQRGSDGVYTFRTPSPEPNVLTVTGLPAGMSVQGIMFKGKMVNDAVIDLTAGGGQIDITIGPRAEP